MASKTWLLALTLSFTTHFAFVTCQNEFTNCSVKNVTDQQFREDLKATIEDLTFNIGNNGFKSTHVGKAYATAICRADIQFDACGGCIREASELILQKCQSSSVDAIIWKELCMVRYSNDVISGKLANQPQQQNSSQDLQETEQHDEEWEELLKNLSTQAANGRSGVNAAAGSLTTSDKKKTFYAMVQCLPDLNTADCSRCLSDTIDRLSQCCTNMIRVIFYKPSCTIYSDNYSFYNISRIEELQQSSPGNGDKNKARNIIIIVVSTVVFLITASCIGVFVCKRIKQNRRRGSKGYIQYDYGVIEAATNKFSKDRELGRGGFGVVYQGQLKDGQEIAVKKLSKESSQGDDAFKNELALVASLQHKNLVRLLGFSIKGNERLLVLEFVQNRSLDKHIFGRDTSSSLDWASRRKIIGGIAKGLEYLHGDSGYPVIHRDLKASNILLEQDMNPKISDFGIARLVGQDASLVTTRNIIGTPSYMSPEYRSGHYSTKSDVYSFGILVLEIVIGQSIDEYKGDLISEVWRCWCEDAILNIVDVTLRANDGAKGEMNRCILIAFKCIQTEPGHRPSMAEVVESIDNPSKTITMPSKPASYKPSEFSRAVDHLAKMQP